MTRLASASRLLRIRRARRSPRSRTLRGTVDEADAVFAANRERLLRFIVARGAGGHAQDILQAVHRAIATGDFVFGRSPANAMFRLAEDFLVEHRASPNARRTAAAACANADLSGATLQALGDRVATVFRRHRIDGLSQREVARELGIDRTAVERDLELAYAALVELRDTAPGCRGR